MHATRAKVWAPHGTYLRLPSWDDHGKWTVYMMLDPRTGETLTHVAAKWNQNEFITLLEKVAGRYPDVPVRLVLDNGIIHYTKAVRAWLQQHENIQITPLPIYCSELNPVESVWRQLRRSVTDNHTFKTMTALWDAINTWLAGCKSCPLSVLRYARINPSQPQIHLQLKPAVATAPNGARLYPL